MRQVNAGTAYLLWCLCFFGICGGQRFYTGNIVSGLVYLFTFGVFGLGQLLDLVLIPGMVDRRNIYLRGLAVGNTNPSINHSITLNLSDIPQLKQPQGTQSPSTASGTDMQKLLRLAKEHGGTLSPAQVAMSLDLEPEVIKDLLQDAVRNDYADIYNDPDTGAVRYRFDL